MEGPLHSSKGQPSVCSPMTIAGLGKGPQKPCVGHRSLGVRKLAIHPVASQHLLNETNQSKMGASTTSDIRHLKLQRGSTKRQGSGAIY